MSANKDDKEQTFLNLSNKKYSEKEHCGSNFDHRKIVSAYTLNALFMILYMIFDFDFWHHLEMLGIKDKQSKSEADQEFTDHYAFINIHMSKTN